MGSSSHQGFIRVPGQEADEDNFDLFFHLLDNNDTCMLSVFIRIVLMRQF